MANLPETPQWEEGIYQIEVSDPVLGGPDGISNRQGKQLASRTLYLKQQVEKGGTDLANHIAAADPHTQYAPKASPTFTGTPTAPTPANSDNSKKLATTEFVAKALAALAGSAPETLDTLKELADALGNDPNFATTVLNKLAEKLAKDQNGADIPDPALFVKNLGLGDASGYVGRWVNTRVFTSSDTYTPTPGTKRIRVTITGGGGGGGSSQAHSSNETFFGAGGGAGGTIISTMTPTQNSYPVTIGAGGAGGVSATNGLKGGDSVFASLIAPGGQGGGKMGATNTNGGEGGAPNTGDIRINGGYGGDGQSGNIGVSGEGGASYWGGGGRAGAGGGVSGNAYGSGGGGAYDAGYSGTSMTGGKGAAGICIIEEFA
ncbi:glycine-rich domain-containing protein [Enterobacter cloacae]|uniref:glycine-rich domain-containing protein n=1 Tax=Enterobacter cloacae TaxID=550 RepID=UPI0031D28A2A